jgi:DNA-directed RNA polymerase specialized sigma24 family protein
MTILMMRLMMSPDECVEQFGSFAMSLIGSWSRWGGVDEMEQAAILGLLEANSRADWAAIECGDGRYGHSPDRLFMSFARPYIVNELKTQALLSFPVSGAGDRWGLSHGMPSAVSFDESIDAAPTVESGDANILADLWAAASGLDTRAESMLLGTFMLGYNDEFMAEFFGMSERHVRRLRADALVRLRAEYRGGEI